VDKGQGKAKGNQQEELMTIDSYSSSMAGKKNGVYVKTREPIRLSWKGQVTHLCKFGEGW